MGQGKQLSESEVKTILKLHEERLSITKIAKTLKRSKKVILNLLKDPENYRKKKSPDRPSALSDREKRAILRVASNSTSTARDIMAKAGVDTKIDNVRRLLRNSDHITRKKLQRKPPLTECHKRARLEFAEEHIRWKKKWRKVIFTDEKKFNLDGPDGWNYYFHDLRKGELNLSRRQMGGGSVMIWAGIGYKGKTDIKVISGKMKANDYLELIRVTISQRAVEISEENFIFQHDNAAVRTARVVKEYFQENNIAVLNWPARSPDLNIIENVWGELARLVYAGSRQYETVAGLKAEIETCWNRISLQYVQKLYKSLHKRLLEVIKNSGGSTHY